MLEEFCLPTGLRGGAVKQQAHRSSPRDTSMDRAKTRPPDHQGRRAPPAGGHRFQSAYWGEQLRRLCRSGVDVSATAWL
jgi:hypothetical protein